MGDPSGKIMGKEDKSLLQKYGLLDGAILTTSTVTVHDKPTSLCTVKEI